MSDPTPDTDLERDAELLRRVLGEGWRLCALGGRDVQTLHILPSIGGMATVSADSTVYSLVMELARRCEAAEAERDLNLRTLVEAIIPVEALLLAGSERLHCAEVQKGLWDSATITRTRVKEANERKRAEQGRAVPAPLPAETGVGE